MSPDYTVSVLLMGIVAIGALAALVLGLSQRSESDEEALRRSARREELRQEMDRHPADRTDWRQYRRAQGERLRRPYSGMGK
jgi:hypothetical protein